MKKTIATLTFALAAAVASPVFAEAEIPQKVQFSHEGVTYTYTKTQVGESTVFKGYATPGYAFHLVARKGQVTGRANGIPVSFKAPTVQDQAQAAATKSIPLAVR